MFQNFPNTTRRFAALGILDNFEISLAVLLPNTTTSHAIPISAKLDIMAGDLSKFSELFYEDPLIIAQSNYMAYGI